MASTPSWKPPSISWIRLLAEPYLRGYRPRAQQSGSLRGYWFTSPAFPSSSTGLSASAGATRAGFFTGYLLSDEGFGYLTSAPPECLVFAFVEPMGGTGHRRLVREREALLRKTFAYVRWLTHRPPRFAFHDDRLTTLVRHVSMRDWPLAKYEHFSRNFYIETLAWLVRSGLVRKLMEVNHVAITDNQPAKVSDSTRKAKSHLRKTSASG